jgi:antitoxin (DNA-binding transcriptional repressor) of toxin-antitoxin stability system
MAMERISITDLRRRTSEIVRRLKNNHVTFEVTYRGEVVGQLVPTSRAPISERDMAASGQNSINSSRTSPRRCQTARRCRISWVTYDVTYEVRHSLEKP